MTSMPIVDGPHDQAEFLPIEGGEPKSVCFKTSGPGGELQDTWVCLHSGREEPIGKGTRYHLGGSLSPFGPGGASTIRVEALYDLPGHVGCLTVHPCR